MFKCGAIISTNLIHFHVTFVHCALCILHPISIYGMLGYTVTRSWTYIHLFLSQMSINLSTPTPPLRLKRVDFEDSHNTDTFKCKRRRLSQPPSPGLAPCLRPLSQTLEQPGSEKHHVSRIGPYILLEATEGAQTFRAVHQVTEQEYTCKVSIDSSL